MGRLKDQGRIEKGIGKGHSLSLHHTSPCDHSTIVMIKLTLGVVFQDSQQDSQVSLRLALQDSQENTQEDLQVLADLDFGEEYINEGGITLRDEVIAPTPSPSVSSRSSSFASRGSSPSVKCASKRRRAAADDSESCVDNSIKALGNYFGKKEQVGDFAASMGQLVQSAANKLPFEKQVQLLQHITRSIATVTGRSEEEI